MSLGLSPARMEIETVRQMWAEEVNRQLETARSTERVDHRSLAAQREEALQKGDHQKAAELDQAPQVKLGWKVVQMERRGDFSDRGNQLRSVQADNLQRQAVVLNIGQLRTQLAQRQAQATLRRQQAEQKKILGQVEQAFRGQSRRGQEAILSRWRYLAGKEILDIEKARAIWEQDPLDPDAKTWRETRSTIAWETQQVAQSSQAVADWHRTHPVQSLILRTGLMKPPGTLQQLQQRQGTTVRFLEGSQRRLQELEQVWTKKELVYQQQLERQGGEIREARRNLQVVKQNPEHFHKVWERDDQSFRHERREQERHRSRDRDRGGWSR